MLFYPTLLYNLSTYLLINKLSSSYNECTAWLPYYKVEMIEMSILASSTSDSSLPLLSIHIHHDSPICLLVTEILSLMAVVQGTVQLRASRRVISGAF